MYQDGLMVKLLEFILRSDEMGDRIPRKGEIIISKVDIDGVVVAGDKLEVIETSDSGIFCQTGIYYVTLDYGEFDLIPERTGRQKNNSEDAPDHYNAHSIEVIDFIQDWDLNFSLGNVVKYVARSPYKGTQMADLLKARNYLDFEIKRLEKWRVNDEAFISRSRIHNKGTH